MGNKMLWYQDAEQEEKEIQANRWRKLEAHKPLFQIAMEYGCRFSHNHNHPYDSKERASNMTFALGIGTINCLALDLYLGEEDSIIREIGPIIEDLKEHPDLAFTGETQELDLGWKAWIFNYRNGKESSAHLKVRCWFEASKKCRKQGTGKFKEVMEIICEE